MISAKQVILTAIYFKGVEYVKQNAAQYADDCLCSKSNVLNVVRAVEKGRIVIAQ